MALPPGPPLPGVVFTAALIAAPARMMDGMVARYGDIFTIRTIPFGTEVVVTQPAAIKQVLTGDSDTYGAAEANRALGLVLGDRSLLLLDGPPHVRLRKLMLPPFHGDRMQPLAATMRDATHRAFRDAHSGDEIALQPVFQRITLEIILQAVMGLPAGESAAPLREALTELVNQFQHPLGLFLMSPSVHKIKLPFATPWDKLHALLEKTDALLFEHVRARRGLKGAERPRDLLDMLLDARDEDGAPMSDKELRDQLMTLLLAGHETTATSLSWAMEEILHCPGEAARLADEVRGVTGGAPLEAEHVGRLTRIDSVVKEVLRMYPVTGAAGRVLKRPTVIQGYELPAGIMVGTNFSLLHRRPDLYPDPHSFKPERFIGKKVDPYEWIPFGAGAHRCLGMHFALYEMKIVLATLLSRLDLAAVREKASVGLRSFMLTPRGGTRVRVLRRAAAARA
jgi:cytochrome P450